MGNFVLVVRVIDLGENRFIVGVGTEKFIYGWQMANWQVNIKIKNWNRID